MQARELKRGLLLLLKVGYMNKLKLISLCAVLATSSYVEADTKSKVESWFDDMNYANVTQAGVYEGQSARYATLGGVSTRAPITQPFNLVDVQTPSFSAGCGGIDMYLGGFSAVNADQFIENLRAIGQNAKSLSFMLAIQIVSPQLSGIMNDVQNWANKYLNMNMDSCEAASALVGGGLSLLDKEKSNCITTRQQTYGEDFTTASYQCTTGGSRKSTTNSDGDRNTADFIEGNLAWYVLMQDPFFKNDLEFSQLVMNITGTVIMSQTAGGFDSPTSIKFVEPSINSTTEKERFTNIYNALLYGRDSTNNLIIYKCTSLVNSIDGCQTVSGSPQSVTPNWDGLYKKVDLLMQSIVSKIKSDSALTAQEKGLISSTRIPVYRYLSAITTQFPSTVPLESITNEFQELIAQDILLSSLNAVVQRVEMSLGTLKNGLSASESVIEFKEKLQEVMAGISQKQKENKLTAEKYIRMREEIRKYERQLMPKISGQIASAAMFRQGG